MYIAPIRALMNNLKFLGFNTEDHCNGTTMTIDDGLFTSGQDNTRAFQYISYFLFKLINAERTLIEFRSAWPVQTVQQGQEFITASLGLLNEFKNQYFENVPLRENTLIACQGESIILLLLALSKTALDKIAVELEQNEIKSSSQLEIHSGHVELAHMRSRGEESQKLLNGPVEAEKQKGKQKATVDCAEPQRQEMGDIESATQKNKNIRAKETSNGLKSVEAGLIKPEHVRSEAARSGDRSCQMSSTNEESKTYDGLMKGLQKTLEREKVEQISSDIEQDVGKEVSEEEDYDDKQQEPTPTMEEVTLPTKYKNIEQQTIEILSKEKHLTATRPDSVESDDDRKEIKSLKHEANERLERLQKEQIGLEDKVGIKKNLSTKQGRLKLEQATLLERARIRGLHEEKVIEEYQQQQLFTNSFTIKEGNDQKENTQPINTKTQYMKINHPSEFRGKILQILSRPAEEVEEFNIFSNLLPRHNTPLTDSVNLERNKASKRLIDQVEDIILQSKPSSKRRSSLFES